MLYSSPRDTWARRGEALGHCRAPGHWMHPLLTPLLPASEETSPFHWEWASMPGMVKLGWVVWPTCTLGKRATIKKGRERDAARYLQELLKEY